MYKFRYLNLVIFVIFNLHKYFIESKINLHKYFMMTLNNISNRKSDLRKLDSFGVV